MGPGQNTRTMKTVQYKPQAASAKCWGHFHLRKVCLEVKGPPRHRSLMRCGRCHRIKDYTLANARKVCPRHVEQSRCTVLARSWRTTSTGCGSCTPTPTGPTMALRFLAILSASEALFAFQRSHLTQRDTFACRFRRDRFSGPDVRTRCQISFADLPISFTDFRSVEYQSDSISQAWPAPLIFH